MKRVDFPNIEAHVQRFKNGVAISATNTGKYIQHLHALRIGNAVDIEFLQGKFESEEAIIRRIMKAAPISELYFSTGIRGIDLGTAAQLADAIRAAL